MWENTRKLNKPRKIILWGQQLFPERNQKPHTHKKRKYWSRFVFPKEQTHVPACVCVWVCVYGCVCVFVSFNFPCVFLNNHQMGAARACLYSMVTHERVFTHIPGRGELRTVNWCCKIRRFPSEMHLKRPHCGWFVGMGGTALLGQSSLGHAQPQSILPQSGYAWLKVFQGGRICCCCTERGFVSIERKKINSECHHQRLNSFNAPWCRFYRSQTTTVRMNTYSSQFILYSPKSQIT